MNAVNILRYSARKLLEICGLNVFEKVLRLLIIITLLVLLFTLLKRFFTEKNRSLDKTRANRVAKMVQCDYCKLYLPDTSAIKHASRYYCCAEHVNSEADDDAP